MRSERAYTRTVLEAGEVHTDVRKNDVSRTTYTAASPQHETIARQTCGSTPLIAKRMLPVRCPGPNRAHTTMPIASEHESAAGRPLRSRLQRIDSNARVPHEPRCTPQLHRVVYQRAMPSTSGRRAPRRHFHL